MGINRNFNKKVWRLVKLVPKGKVTTYGQISNELRIMNHELCKRYLRGEKILHLGGGRGAARAVGNALHRNRDPKVPCHRVVDRNGRLAGNYAFGGAIEQRKRLLAEGVKFKDEMHVDLEKCSWEK